MPGSPSLVGRKPGKFKFYTKLVTCEGLGGSNPSPGALLEKNGIQGNVPYYHHFKGAFPNLIRHQ